MSGKVYVKVTKGKGKISRNCREVPHQRVDLGSVRKQTDR